MGDGVFCAEDRKKLQDLGCRLWKPDFIAKSRLLDGVFPSEADYDDSYWANWRRRIEEGEQVEHERESNRFDELVRTNQINVDNDDCWSIVTEGLCGPLKVSNAMCGCARLSPCGRT